MRARYPDWRWRVVVLVIATVLAVLAFTDAGQGADVTDRPAVARGVRAARVHFGRLPDCPLQPLAVITGWARAGYFARGQDPNQVFAWADQASPSLAPASCVITINVLWWPDLRRHPRWLCTVVVHEIGHLLGYRHRARGVMTAHVDPDHPTHQCR